MENTQTETKTETVAAQDPVTEKPAAATPAQAQPAAETPQPEPKADQKEIARNAFRQRDDKREKKAAERVADLERELQELRAKAMPKEIQPEPTPSLLDNPEGYEKYLIGRAEKAGVDAFESQRQKAEAQYHHAQASEAAVEFLLTRSHLKEDDKLTAEVGKVIAEKYGRLAHMEGGNDPVAAARLAYLDVCAAKGIAPDLPNVKSQGFDATAGRASTQTPPSASSGAKRNFSRAEAEKYLLEAASKPGEFKKRTSEVEEAKREGRIK